MAMLAGVAAVTWGVFPNREILQPTIFDTYTYSVWAQEAFHLWLSMWAPLYDEESRYVVFNVCAFLIIHVQVQRVDSSNS
jgi:hypothetical protein